MHRTECIPDFLLNLIFDLIKCIEIDVLALVEFRQYYLLLLKEIKTTNCKIVTDPHPLLPSFSCLKICDIQYDNFPTLIHTFQCLTLSKWNLIIIRL